MALVLALLAHAVLRVPTCEGRLLRGGDGRWSVPDRGLVGLELDPRTRYAGWWVHLVLTAPGRQFECVLLRDQLSAPEWSALLAGLRTGSWAAVPDARPALLE